jgi:hypothetical protein
MFNTPHAANVVNMLEIGLTGYRNKLNTHLAICGLYEIIGMTLFST